MATKNRVRRPKREFADIIQAGIKAQDLATEHQAVLELRLPKGCLVSIGTDIGALKAQIPGAEQARSVAIVATATQTQTLEQGYTRFAAIRAAVTLSNASIDVQKAYGIGLRINPKVVKDVRFAIQQVVQRATDNPSEASSLGILAKDINALKASLALIQDTDTTQEKQRAAAPVSTLTRNKTARRVVDAIDRIAAAGVLEFADDPAIRASFEALIGAGNKNKKKKKAKPAEAAPKADRRVGEAARAETKAAAKPDADAKPGAGTNTGAASDADADADMPPTTRYGAAAKAEAHPRV